MTTMTQPTTPSLRELKELAYELVTQFVQANGKGQLVVDNTPHLKAYFQHTEINLTTKNDWAAIIEVLQTNQLDSPIYPQIPERMPPNLIHFGPPSLPEPSSALPDHLPEQIEVFYKISHTTGFTILGPSIEDSAAVHLGHLHYVPDSETGRFSRCYKVIEFLNYHIRPNPHYPQVTAILKQEPVNFDRMISPSLIHWCYTLGLNYKGDEASRQELKDYASQISL